MEQSNMNAGECFRKPIIKPEYPEILDWFLYKMGGGKSRFFFIYKKENGKLYSFAEEEYEESLEGEEKQIVNEKGKIKYVPQ